MNCSQNHVKYTNPKIYICRDSWPARVKRRPPARHCLRSSVRRTDISVWTGCAPGSHGWRPAQGRPMWQKPLHCSGSAMRAAVPLRTGRLSWSGRHSMTGSVTFSKGVPAIMQGTAWHAARFSSHERLSVARYALKRGKYASPIDISNQHNRCIGHLRHSKISNIPVSEVDLGCTARAL